MKKISMILVAATFAVSALSANKAQKECRKGAEKSRAAALKECKAKPKAERVECRKGAQTSHAEAIKACKTASAAPAPAAAAPATAPSTAPAEGK